MTEEEYLKNPWWHNKAPFVETKNHAGFVYIITDLETNKKYIGKKFLTSTRAQKGKTRRVTSESNWRDYWSSSKELQALIEAKGKDKFKREIMVLGKTKGEVNFAEVFAQMLAGVLESDDWINDAINKWRKVNVEKYQSLSEIRNYFKEPATPSNETDSLENL